MKKLLTLAIIAVASISMSLDARRHHCCNEVVYAEPACAPIVEYVVEPVCDAVSTVVEFAAAPVCSSCR